MKTNFLILTIVSFLLGGGFAACDDSEEFQVAGIPPVSAPEEVSAFFKAYLPSYSTSAPEPGFDFSESECFLINSAEEFEAIAPAAADLPAIDFGKYTLVIGQYSMGDPGYKLQQQAVDTQTDVMTWNLAFRQLHGAHPDVITTFYFWGLYTKLPEKQLTVSVTVI